MPSDAPPSNFAPIPNRDAAAAIRGFVYQVETTVLRWIELGDDDVLELERGEDIDRISEVAASGALSAESLRTLEQVKRETARLTLRSEGARAALAHLHAYRVAHPEIRISLRYTTTAELGTERDRSGPGIAVWQSICDGTIAKDKLPVALVGLREVLQGGVRPNGVSPTHWEVFQRFVAESNNDAFGDFVKRVEWSAHSADEHAVAEAIHASLQAAGIARDLEDAQSLRERLLVHVWSVLTTAGLKRLTSADLRQALARPTLGVGERARLDGLYALLEQISARVETLERTVDLLAQSHELQGALIAQSTSRIDQLTQAAGIRAVVAALVAAPSLEAPPVVSPGAARAESVDRVLQAHSGASWLAFFGASGMGKSQFALRAALRVTERPAWVSFRDLTTYPAALRLDAALSSMAGHSHLAPPTQDELERILHALTPRACLVLDDVPRFTPDDEFGRRLIVLAAACAATSVRLFSTSVHDVLRSVADRLRDRSLATVPVPPFTSEDVRELFVAWGAEGPMLDQPALGLAATLRHGHPVLLQVFARRLSQRGWPDTSAKALAAILQGQSDEALNEETLQRLLETVEDSNSRQLLARLTLVGGEFGLDEVRGLAAVDPRVDQPRARLHAVTGTWVQAGARQRYSLSPLVRELGSVDVDPDTAARCHVVLARQLVGRDTIDQLGAIRAFGHFIAGGESAAAALLLVRALKAAMEGPVQGSAPLFLSLWVDTPLPEELPLELALFVRAAQIRSRQVWGESTESLEADLEHRLASAGADEAWAVFAAAAFMLGGELTREHLQRSVRWIRLLLTSWTAVDLLWRASDFPGPPAPIGLIVWYAIPDEWDVAGLYEWLDLLEAVPAALHEVVFGAVDAHTSAVQAAMALVASEEKRPTSERQWDKVLEALADMERRAGHLGCEAVWAAAASARLFVLGQYQNDLVAAEREAQILLDRASSAESRFLISETIGMVYVDARNLDEAGPWLSSALAWRTTVFPRRAILATLWASVAAGRHDVRLAAELGLDAVERARAEFNAGDVGLVDALIETGLALWRAGDARGGIALWDEAGRKIYDRADHDEEATARLTVLLYPLSYYSSHTRARDDLSSASATLGAPEPGAMLRARRRADAPATARALSGFALLMSELAQAVGEDGIAADWARSGRQHARDADDLVTVALLTPALAPDALESGEEESLLHELLIAGNALGRHNLSSEPPTPIGDGHAVAYGLLPMALRLGLLALEDSPEVAAVARRAALACRSVAEVSSDPEMWRKAAHVMERGFIERAAARDLISMVEHDASTDGQLATAVRSVAYLAASLDRALSPQDALRGHLAVLLWIEPILLSAPRLYRATLSQFLVAYWRSALQRAGFRFSAPRALATVLAEVASLPAGRATRPLVGRLARAVMTSLGVRGGERVDQWLSKLGDDDR